ncbi:Tim44 domain-containing protein [Halomonas huangheensis]|nr:TIM44-like domain-containing protein [Halomonas huangheensis]ALM54792.1 preprotein translocase subunit Tim44 [Halomonas huangheensis]
MRHFIVMLLVGMLGAGLALDTAEARRMGGGKSVGSFSRQADQPSATQSAAARPNQATPGTAPRKGGFMGGMFGGLLAGGLLGALFFGGAFDELRLMDILLIAGVAFLLFKLFARRRTAAAAAAAAASGPQHSESPDAMSRQQHDSNAFGMPGSSGTPTGPVADPEWFDRERFLGGAKEHFMTLQRAWDNNDLSGIQEYVTPELYNLLREERANQPANNRTEVIHLLAELGGVREYGNQAEARVLFHGVLEENGEKNEFNETWHLIRDLRDGAPWYVQGIEQND